MLVKQKYQPTLHPFCKMRRKGEKWLPNAKAGIVVGYCYKQVPLSKQRKVSLVLFLFGSCQVFQ